MKQRYININKELIPVSEEIYQTVNRWKENERHRARRDGECGQSDYRYCSGDCATCSWHTAGSRSIPLSELIEKHDDDKSLDLSDSRPLVEEIVADRLLLEELYRKLDDIIPDGGRVFQMRANDYTERDIAQALGIKTQSTLNYRIRKMDEYIRAHRDEFEDYLK